MRSFNATWEFEYHFFVSHVAVKPIKVGGAYAFHYQGIIGGEPEKSPKDYVVLKDGTKRDISMEMGLLAGTGITGKQLPSPFLYLGDSDEKKTQVFFLGAKNLPEAHEDEGWLAGCPDKSPIVAVFSFGRRPGKDYTITGTDPIFIFGFQPKAAGHESISTFLDARLVDPLKAGSGGTPTGGTTATGGTTGAGGATGTGGMTGTGGSTASSGGTTATSGGATASSGGTTTSSGGTTATSGGTPASGGSTSNSGSGGAAAGGQTSIGGSQASGGSTSKADAGTSTPSKSSSGGCSVGQVGGVPGAGYLFAFTVLTLWLSGRRRKR
jgi:hypothetical protein